MAYCLRSLAAQLLLGTEPVVHMLTMLVSALGPVAMGELCHFFLRNGLHHRNASRSFSRRFNLFGRGLLRFRGSFRFLACLCHKCPPVLNHAKCAFDYYFNDTRFIL